MPEMTVWPVSSSLRTRKVGSSSDRRPSAVASLSWSAFVLGSTATSMTGSGNVMFSSSTEKPSALSVSPVVVCLSPTAAAISPGPTDSRSSRLLACICRIRPTRSFRPVVTFVTCEPAFSTPE